MFADSPGDHGYQAVRKLFEKDVFRVISSTKDNYVYWPDKDKLPTVYLNKRTLYRRFRNWYYWVLATPGMLASQLVLTLM